mmetsp:Transcript_8501/g.18292  ORF Transcript_8501/g.18292 Transcript_8501/m.18292 type:complete len:411 (-) Transcript_8501:62-1294(-)
MVSVLGINVPDEKTNLCFFLCAGGIFFFYLVHSYSLEWLKNAQILQYGWVVTLIQCVVYVILAAGDRAVRGAGPRKGHATDYMKIGFLQVASLSLSNFSAQYLNVPTQMMFKSSKLLPVMLVNEIYFRRRHDLGKYIAALFLVSGLVLFTLVDSQMTPDFNLSGVGLVCLALLADALIGSVQEDIMKNRGATNDEMVLYSHLVGGAYVLIVATATMELMPGLRASTASVPVVGCLAVYSSVGFFGVSFVMAMISRFGCVITVTVTSTRKVLSIFLSFLLYPKNFSASYGYAFSVFFLGLCLEVVVNNKTAKEAVQSFLLRARWWRRRSECVSGLPLYEPIPAGPVLKAKGAELAALRPQTPPHRDPTALTKNPSNAQVHAGQLIHSPAHPNGHANGGPAVAVIGAGAQAV